MLDHRAGTAEQLPAGQQRIRAPCRASPRTGPLPHVPSGLAIDVGGHGPAAGHVQHLGRGQHVALGREVAGRVVVPTVGDLVVLPDPRAVVGAHGIQEHTFGGENPGAEVNDAPIDQPTGPDRPQGDHLAAPEHPIGQRGGVERPDGASVCRIEAVHVAVVGPDEHPAARDRGRESHRPARDERPAQLASGGVQRVDLVVRRRSEIRRAFNHRDVVRVVKTHAMLFEDARHGHGQGRRPGLDRSASGCEAPVLDQRRGQVFRRDATTRDVVLMCRPVLRVQGGAGERPPQPQSDQCQNRVTAHAPHPPRRHPLMARHRFRLHYPPGLPLPNE